MSRRIAIFFLLLCATGLLQAQGTGYRIVHPDGTVEFTDQPAPGAKEIALPQAQGYEAPPVPRPTPPAASPSPPKEETYKRVAIVAPGADETLRDGETTVQVRVEVLPTLKPEHRLAILLDGAQVAEGRGPGFDLRGIERGTHALVAEIRDAQGKTVQRSVPVTFHMRQHSRLFDAPPSQPNGTQPPVSPAPQMPKAPRMP